LFLRSCGRDEQQRRDHNGSLLEAVQIHEDSRFQKGKSGLREQKEI
jgi:hypothetical protein